MPLQIKDIIDLPALIESQQVEFKLVIVVDPVLAGKFVCSMAVYFSA